MRVNRKLQRTFAYTLSACAAALCLGAVSCVSPDLEPPGTLGTHPESPGATDHGANAGKGSKAADAGVSGPPTGGRNAAQVSDEDADAGVP